MSPKTKATNVKTETNTKTRYLNTKTRCQDQDQDRDYNIKTKKILDEIKKQTMRKMSPCSFTGHVYFNDVVYSS